MNRAHASQLLRKMLDDNMLNDWHIRLNMDLSARYLGLCDHARKTIVMNAHHVDSHPDPEIIDTIGHEVAHAIVGPSHGHDDVWKEKARMLGANPLPCSFLSLDPAIINEIRSGNEVTVEFETHTVYTPKYTVTRFQDKCTVCGKVAKVKDQRIVKTSMGRKKITTLECNHVLFADAESTSPFEEMTFDGDPNCSHRWGQGKARTICEKCGAKRLYEYQIKGAQALEEANGRCALFDEQGLGKTIQGGAYLRYHRHDAWPYLWITKSGIRYQHLKEILRVVGRDAFPQIIHKGTDTLIPGMAGYIASYDIFRRFPNLDMFREAGIKTVILDECQAIKNPDSSRTQAIRRAIRDIPRIIPMSGTPWKNRGSEFFVVLNMLDPKMFGNYERFKRDWVAVYYEGNREKEGGIKNPEEFKKKIAHIAIRRERKEVMPELPLISRHRLTVEVPEHARKVYQEEEDALVNTYNQAVIDGMEDSFATQKQIMENLMRMRQIVGLSKVDSTCEFAQEFLEETDRKLCIFVHHKACGEQIFERMSRWCMENNEPQPLKLSAELSGEDRMKMQDEFNGPYRRLLIASTLASGEGLNLQTCSDCILHERQWNPANEEQVEGRFIRIGQVATAVTATYVHGDDTVDTILDGIVESKRREFANTMNKDGYVPTWNEQGIVKQLAEAIAARRKNGKKVA